MFCPKCGSQFDGTNICPNCLFDTTTIDTTTVATIPDTFDKTSASPDIINLLASNTCRLKAAAFIVLGCVVLFLFFSAANQISESGFKIMNISSVGGTTLDEAYYFELGGIYEGYATISRAAGIFFGAILFG